MKTHESTRDAHWSEAYTLQKLEPSVESTTGRERQGRVSRAIRRAFDVCIAAVILLITAPLCAIIALAIKLTSRGPVLFRQVRVGHVHKPFVMLKFRSMHHNVDDTLHRTYVSALLTDSPDARNEKGRFKLADDPRVTRVGSIIRRVGLDELPQLLNVLRGDMSVVGPRPALPFEVELYESRHHGRFAVRPGLTGLWQVSGRNQLNMKQMLDLDLVYVDQQSFRLDLSILLQTVPAMIRGDGAE
jgi:lipopolysaccharide/colanic/teichoic acid biosynthesis glycosyltransferase